MVETPDENLDGEEERTGLRLIQPMRNKSRESLEILPTEYAGYVRFPIEINRSGNQVPSVQRVEIRHQDDERRFTRVLLIRKSRLNLHSAMFRNTKILRKLLALVFIAYIPL